MFGRKPKNAPIEAPKPPEGLPGYSDVYVMPEKYVVQSKKGNGKGFLVVSVILVAVILLTAGYLLYDMISRQPKAPEVPVAPPVIEVPVMEPSIIETTTTLEIIAETTTPEISTSTSNQVPAAAAPSLDSDNDSFTNVEETVLGTMPNNPDTDGDGYKDGIEVAAGYNPSKAGTSKLNESPFVVSLTTNFNSDNFKILYPKDWQASFVASAKQVLINISTGEIIRITARDNQLGQSVMAWYLQDHPEAVVSQMRVAEAGPLTGLYAPNGLAAYLTDANRTKFYIFEYLAGQQTELRYLTLFSAIIKSLTIIPNPIAPNQNITNASTPANNQVCQGYLCYEEPCGLLVSGQNSCLSATIRKTCYDKTCATDADCSENQVCTQISCWDGDAGVLNNVCQ